MLKVKNLSKDFLMHIRDGLLIEGFKGINFEVNKNSLLSITGESGAGKSTLLKCIYRTYIPSSGEVIYEKENGEIIDLTSATLREIISLRKNEIGYVSQFLNVIPRISALDILTTRLRDSSLNIRNQGNQGNQGNIGNIGNIESEEREEEVAKELLKKVRLSEELWKMYPSTFSGGEKQRLNILLALASKPRLLLLDEPTASLDSRSKEIIYEMILEAKKNGTTMIGVFHDREAIDTLSDREFHLLRSGTGSYVV